MSTEENMRSKRSEASFIASLSNSTRGMLLFDDTVDAKPEIDLLQRFHYPFIPLNVQGYMIPALETTTARYVGARLIERYLLTEWKAEDPHTS